MILRLADSCHWKTVKAHSEEQASLSPYLLPAANYQVQVEKPTSQN